MLIKSFIFIIITCSVILCESGYNTIYLMEFENQQNEFTNSHLTEALPDLIKENYKFREDIKVEYSGDIRPYLKQNDKESDAGIKGLIINGRFLTINDEFFVEFEAYDIHDWQRLVRRQIFCPVQDLICVHDQFLMAIEQSISPFLVDALNINETIKYLEKKPKKRTPGFDLDENNNDIENLKKLDAINKGNINSKNEEQGQYGNRYYREFDIKYIEPDPDPLQIKRENTGKLINILDQFLDNPYEVMIGDLSISRDSNQKDNYNGEIPIEYAVRSSLSQELLNNLPHDKIIDDAGNVIMQFSKNNFVFDDSLMQKLSLMKFQLMPVIFFNSRIGSTQFIILDSWNKKYEELDLQEFPMFMENKFKPLFALTPGVNQIQLDLDISSHLIKYQFSIPNSKIKEYTKVIVKFMKEEELDLLLKNQNRGGY